MSTTSVILNLPVPMYHDYRWLNCYRILETRFNVTGAGLDKSQKYRDFVQKNSRLSRGKIAEIRGSIHAFARGSRPGIGQYNSKYGEEMEKTFHDINLLAIEAINTHPLNKGLRLFAR